MAIRGRNKAKKILLATPGQDLGVGTRFIMDIEDCGDTVYEVIPAEGLGSDLHEGSICELCGLDGLCNNSYQDVPRCLYCDRKDNTSVYFRKLS